MSASHCSNCGTAVGKDDRFCASCGQALKEFSRPWLEIIRELLDELLDWDGRMLTSFWLLLSRPGFLSEEYIRGRRVSYTSPLRMYLVISLLFFLVLPLILPQPRNLSPDHELSIDLYSKGMFVMLPVFALLLKLFYRKGYYIDHLVFTIHLFSASYVAFALLLSIESLADRYLVAMVVQLVLLVYLLAYIAIALHRVYAESWPRTLAKMLCLLLLFLPALGALIELSSHLGKNDL